MENIENKKIPVIQKVKFYRKGKKYYYTTGLYYWEVNSISLNKLKETLKLPFKVEFEAMSISQIQKVIAMLSDSLTEVEIVNKTTGNILNVETIFYQSKKVIQAVKLKSKSCLYGRANNPTPYILNRVEDKTILIEVPKDYIKANDVEYYYLFSDLADEEKMFFDSCYCELTCDYIYNLNTLKENKPYQRKLNRSIF